MGNTRTVMGIICFSLLMVGLILMGGPTPLGNNYVTELTAKLFPTDFKAILLPPAASTSQKGFWP